MSQYLNICIICAILKISLSIIIKKLPIVLFLQLVLLLLFTKCDKIDLNDPVDISDEAFLHALIEDGVDTDGDGFISFAEAKAVKNLNVDSDSISDMRGIEAFVNLEDLFCWDNELTALDVSSNINLTSLSCSGNQLTSLDVSYNTALRSLNVWSNKLTSLDVTYLPDLRWLDCDRNQLTTLNLSNNRSLTVLSCDHNQLTSLDLSNLVDLDHLECGSNLFTSLDISNNSKLGKVYIGYLCLVISDMPSLQEVCVWTLPFPPEGLNITTSGSPNVYFTTDCIQ